MSRPSARRLPDQQWLEAYPPRLRRLLRRHGVPPEVDPRASKFNEDLLAIAEQGLQGMELDRAAHHLHDQVFGDALTRAGNAEYFRDLIEFNRAGDVEQLAFVVFRPDRVIAAGMIGSSDLPYVVRSIDAVADFLDAVCPDSQPWGLLPEPPPPSSLAADQRLANRARVETILRDLSAANARGEVAGAAMIVFGRRPAAYSFMGSIPTRDVARLLRGLRDQIARGNRNEPRRDATH